jgi:hypothetical protein
MLRNHRIVWPEGRAPGGGEAPAADMETDRQEHHASIDDSAPSAAEDDADDDFMEKDEDDFFEWDQLEFRSPISADDFRKEMAPVRKGSAPRRKRGPERTAVSKVRAR